MRLLVDESVDMAIVRALRQAGHEVLAIAEECPGVEDAYVAELARNDERILLTEDRDFGRLVFASNGPAYGVIYMRNSARARLAFCNEVVQGSNKKTLGFLTPSQLSNLVELVLGGCHHRQVGVNQATATITATSSMTCTPMPANSRT